MKNRKKWILALILVFFMNGGGEEVQAAACFSHAVAHSNKIKKVVNRSRRPCHKPHKRCHRKKMRRGPTGPTGPIGATGATGPCIPIFASQSTQGVQVVGANDPIPLPNSLITPQGIDFDGTATFTVLTSGIYAISYGSSSNGITNISLTVDSLLTVFRAIDVNNHSEASATIITSLLAGQTLTLVNSSTGVSLFTAPFVTIEFISPL